MTKRVTIIVKTDPSREKSRVTEALRIAAAMIGMDLIPRILFCCGGVRCLLRGKERGREDYWGYLKAVADLAGLYLLSSKEEKEPWLSDLEGSLSLRLISPKEAAEMISESDIVFAL
ncbi:hypothetical protein DRO56_05325 [Candidatus Bathyarchaeota archaeon]|nr:MAG: hypothetical protein CW700_05470 [Candidatus Bathyarchaeota archaeon]RLI31285.1 MAG: hypothetical protein DRO56_05325 [Candidatus Bathyarchaeota archaeon]